MSLKVKKSMHYLVGGFAVMMFISCDQATENADSAKSTAVFSAPTDSTGQKGKAALTFKTEGSSALGLADTPVTLDLGNGVVLSEARASISTIKIKPNEIEDADEKKNEEELKDMEKSEEAKIKDQKINRVLFYANPHVLYDFAIYVICKYYKIKIIIQEDSKYFSTIFPRPIFGLNEEDLPNNGTS